MDYEQYKQIDSIAEKIERKHLMNGSVESKEILAVTQAYRILRIQADKKGHSEIAKMVWEKLTYTDCQINGDDTTVIEIKNVWDLIKELENYCQKAVDCSHQEPDYNDGTNGTIQG